MRLFVHFRLHFWGRRTRLNLCLFRLRGRMSNGLVVDAWHSTPGVDLSACDGRVCVCVSRMYRQTESNTTHTKMRLIIVFFLCARLLVCYCLSGWWHDDTWHWSGAASRADPSSAKFESSVFAGFFFSFPHRWRCFAAITNKLLNWMHGLASPTSATSPLFGRSFPISPLTRLAATTSTAAAEASAVILTAPRARIGNEKKILPATGAWIMDEITAQSHVIVW